VNHLPIRVRVPGRGRLQKNVGEGGLNEGERGKNYGVELLAVGSDFSMILLYMRK
jgi:hypothetical protein